MFPKQATLLLFWKRIKELNAFVIGIRPWRNIEYNKYDKVYTFIWYTFHLIIALLAMQVMVDVYPSTLQWMISLPDSMIEEWIPNLVIAKTGWAGILHNRTKSNKFPEPPDRWRRGEWFPYIWTGLFFIMLMLEFFTVLPGKGLHVVTTALGVIAPFGILIRLVTQELDEELPKGQTCSGEA